MKALKAINLLFSTNKNSFGKSVLLHEARFLDLKLNLLIKDMNEQDLAGEVSERLGKQYLSVCKLSKD